MEATEAFKVIALSALVAKAISPITYPTDTLEPVHLTSKPQFMSRSAQPSTTRQPRSKSSKTSEYEAVNPSPS